MTDVWLRDASAAELAEAIHSGQVTSRRVVEFHIGRLRSRSSLTSVVADRYDAALDEADAVDARIASGEAPGGPLAGVPCTVKESIPVTGMPHTAGMASRRGIVSPTDAVAVQRIRAAGAIVLGVTNTAELCLGIESTNSVHGRTNNPYDERRVSGGSSGGEGAAIGSGGSPIGIGGDTGGSIRIPSFYCGVFGHKPSPGLVPANESVPSLAGDADLDTMETLGPMARRAGDLMPLLRILADDDGTRCGEVGSVDLDGLTVVVPTKSSFVRPMNRAVRDARDAAGRALAEAGADVTWQPMPGMRRVIASYLMELRRHAGMPVMSLFDSLSEKPGRHLTPAVLRADSLQLRLAMIGDRIPELLPKPGRDLLDRYARELADEVFTAVGDGVMLHPPLPAPAPLHHGTLARPWLFGGAAMFNMLGMAVTEVPLGFDPRGLPVGVQVAAAPGNDHVAIAVAEHLESVFGGWVAPEDVTRA
ncbi:amidase [Williamsia deligens]|uniref:Amidase n=1 Tax=Williamsia deligens TaxID=321325 RepID=A0ABW3G5J5_9NOCA|nr:amidase family protein [Williamsia deligens]